MNNNQNWQQISRQIQQATQQSFQVINSQPVAGGCINSAYIIESEKNSYFVKLNQPNLLSMFEAEYRGLEELSQTKTVNVPNPICYGLTTSHAFIVLEKLSLKSCQNNTMQELGQQLAQLHKVQQNFYGWTIDNTIGTTRQINTSSENWLSFWSKNRLNFQLVLAGQNGYSSHLIQSGYKLQESLGLFFKHYSPHPSLLHGDLWSGNAMSTSSGNAIIYDPACYYGDRETDIAMTELFGGFSEHFYAAYNEVYPLHSDYSHRKTLYNLYHILNHLNLFGDSYLHQAQSMIDYLLSEVS